MRNPVIAVFNRQRFERHAARGAEGLSSAKPAIPAWLHVDTTWKFRGDDAFRDETARRLGSSSIVHINHDGAKRGVSPIASVHRSIPQVMKTEALRQRSISEATMAAFGGARRDEEKSRAKGRIFSHRSAAHAWDPRNQRPELWRLFNTRIREGEVDGVFPLSTGRSRRVGILPAEGIPVVPLYFSKIFVRWSSALTLSSWSRRRPAALNPAKRPDDARYGSERLGCYPLTGRHRDRTRDA